MISRMKISTLFILFTLSLNGFARDKVTTVPVEARQNAKSQNWKIYEAQAVTKGMYFIQFSNTKSIQIKKIML